jgi:hypothetical protein
VIEAGDLRVEDPSETFGAAVVDQGIQGGSEGCIPGARTGVNSGQKPGRPRVVSAIEGDFGEADQTRCFKALRWRGPMPRK